MRKNCNFIIKSKLAVIIFFLPIHTYAYAYMIGLNEQKNCNAFPIDGFEFFETVSIRARRIRMYKNRSSLAVKKVSCN